LLTPFASLANGPLNDKRTGRIIIIMQRLHEDDLVGHVLGMEPWKTIRFPAIAQEDEAHDIITLYGRRHFTRRAGEALHPERETIELLNRIREAVGEYNFAGQYQQSPAPLGGGMLKAAWFKTYTPADLPGNFEMVFQSWDTANKPSELSNYSVCSTWGVKDKHRYLLHVYRKRVGYPELKRAVRAQAEAFRAQTVLIEDKASGTLTTAERLSIFIGHSGRQASASTPSASPGSGQGRSRALQFRPASSVLKRPRLLAA
jgi:phage terminase large subunit-like protein